jgi:hypothetical protein
MVLLQSGAFWFGIVIGYVTYRTLQHARTSSVADIATVIAAVGGGAVVALFPADSARFDQYSFGLAAGFFFYLFLSLVLGLAKGSDFPKQLLGD